MIKKYKWEIKWKKIKEKILRGENLDKGGNDKRKIKIMIKKVEEKGEKEEWREDDLVRRRLWG